jgi:hypothetical protein
LDEAVRTYYTSYVKRIHLELLGAVRLHVHEDGAFVDGVGLSYLDMFAKKYSGVPILYGICLQQQQLDTVHEPKKLKIRNNNSPFMHRYVANSYRYDVTHIHKLFLLNAAYSLAVLLAVGGRHSFRQCGKPSENGTPGEPSRRL